MTVVLKAMTFKLKLFFLGSYLFALWSAVAASENGSFAGHIKYQLDSTHYQHNNINAQYGTQSPLNHIIDFRLMAENHWEAWETKIHYEVLALYGDKPKTQQALLKAGLINTASTLPNDNRRLFKLTDKIGHSSKLEAVQRLDRLSVGYNSEQFVIRIGRQAVSWGNGIVFHPLDIFSPFSPTAIDKDYKTGDDMVYGQWLFENGNDLQIILLPRCNPETDKVESEQTTLAFKYRGRYSEQWDFDVLAAHHFDENVLGLGLSRNIGEAMWRFDVNVTPLKQDDTAVSLVTNMDYSWTWFERNVYGYIEYFHNSLGETQPSQYLYLNVALQTRLQRGEIYTLGRDYFASGLQIELTPLLNLYTHWISQLHDNSGLLQIQGTYDWLENLQWMSWLDIPYGEEGTEFGGVPIENNNGNSGLGRKIYIRLIYYF